MPVLPDDQLDRLLEDVDPDLANEIRARYADAVAYQNAGSWSRQQTIDWVTDQIEITTGDEAKATAATTSRTAAEAIGEQAAIAAQRAATAADERAAAVRARYRIDNEDVVDMGPAVDPGQISTSLAVGAWVDDNGNYIDPVTGQRTDTPVPADADTVWQLIRGQRFNMGALTMPGFEERRTRNYTPLRRGFTGTEPGTPPGGRTVKLGTLDLPAPRFDLYGADRPTQTRVLTPSQAMALLNSMDEDYLVSLQQQLWDAGLYAAVGEGLRPDWGHADPITQKAFQQLFIEASLDPRAPLEQVLARLAERNIANLGDVPGAPGSSTGQAPDFQPEVASTETLSRLIDELAANLLGENVDDRTKNELISRLQAEETENQRQRYEQDLDRFNRGGGEGGMAGMEDIDVFMAAIGGLESGGDYTAQNQRTGAYGRFQIMPENWRPWATRAGLGPNAPRTPENQEIVAKRIMMDYFAQFGNWRDVAIAWFAGPDDVGSPSSLAKSDGNMTVAQYADSILDRMADLKGRPDISTAGGGREFAPVERFDPAAEAEAALKAANPDAWFGHQWGEQAIEFFSLLAGVS